MFKYLLLKNYYKLSDRDLIARTKTDMLFKYFLDYSPEEINLIDLSLLTVFRRERLSNKENEEETSTNLYEIEYSKDKDAKVGNKTADTSFFGYKTHIAMTPERIITAATITTGEKHDGKELKKLVEKSRANGIEVEAVIGDGAYSEKENIEYCESNNIKLASNNKELITEVESYFFNIEKCKHCPYKEGCYKEGSKTKTYSVTLKNDVHIKHMDYMETEEFKELYSERYKIEAKNSELKSNFDYDTANACGKNGITIQGASALFLVNIKRIIKLKKEKAQNNG